MNTAEIVTGLLSQGTGRSLGILLVCRQRVEDRIIRSKNSPLTFVVSL